MFAVIQLRLYFLYLRRSMFALFSLFECLLSFSLDCIFFILDVQCLLYSHSLNVCCHLVLKHMCTSVISILYVRLMYWCFAHFVCRVWDLTMGLVSFIIVTLLKVNIIFQIKNRNMSKNEAILQQLLYTSSVWILKIRLSAMVHLQEGTNHRI